MQPLVVVHTGGISSHGLVSAIGLIQPSRSPDRLESLRSGLIQPGWGADSSCCAKAYSYEHENGYGNDDGADDDGDYDGDSDNDDDDILAVMTVIR